MGVRTMEGEKTINISEKYMLTIDEAAQYFNIGKNKLRELTKEPGCTFVIYVGKKCLIKRIGFEQYLDNIVYL